MCRLLDSVPAGLIVLPRDDCAFSNAYLLFALSTLVRDASAMMLLIISWRWVVGFLCFASGLSMPMAMIRICAIEGTHLLLKDPLRGVPSGPAKALLILNPNVCVHRLVPRSDLGRLGVHSGCHSKGCVEALGPWTCGADIRAKVIDDTAMRSSRVHLTEKMRSIHVKWYIVHSDR